MPGEASQVVHRAYEGHSILSRLSRYANRRGSFNLNLLILEQETGHRSLILA